jgi:ribosome-binding protein aMBF1 (putative translation factor)
MLRAEALVGRIASLEREIDALLGIDPRGPALAAAARRAAGARTGARRGQSHSQKGEEIGRRIREARLARGLTQLDLATATGIRRPNVARLERGANTPTLEIGRASCRERVS